jgi:hypothetical protein
MSGRRMMGETGGRKATSVVLLGLATVAACVAAPCIIGGCTTQYLFEFKHGESGAPIADAPVSLSSLPRIYSFLDARHYTGETGKPVVVHERTDEGGKVALGLPSDLRIWYICLNSEWFAREPSSAWQPMLAKHEYEAKVAEADLQTDQQRPLVRMLEN